MIVSYSGGCYSNKHSVWTPTLTVSLMIEIAARTVGKVAYTVWTCCSKGWFTCLRGQCETLSHYSEQCGTKILKIDYFRNCPCNMLKTQLNVVTKTMVNGESHCIFLAILLFSSSHFLEVPPLGIALFVLCLAQLPQVDICLLHLCLELDDIIFPGMLSLVSCAHHSLCCSSTAASCWSLSSQGTGIFSVFSQALPTVPGSQWSVSIY